jgi:hypothetical protein
MKRIGIFVSMLSCVGVLHAGERSNGGDKRKDGPARRNDIVWHNSVDDAIRAAQKASPAKPVFLFRALGELNGKL